MNAEHRKFLFVSFTGLISDIGERWFEDHDKLHTRGYLREV
ncbi:MAG: hypothetical protein ACRET2_14085 [Steroidobacteraceae bacterium]